MEESLRIFIVHGTNHQKLQEVSDFLNNELKKKLKLEIIVLMDEPAGGRVILEKFEQYANSSSYAIVILSNDDYGMSKQDSDINYVTDMAEHIKWLGDSIEISGGLRMLPPKFSKWPEEYRKFHSLFSKIEYRGRQNVILEMGYFFGKIGRDHMAILYSPEVELPSDINGLNYISYDDDGKWKSKIEIEINNFISRNINQQNTLLS